MRLPFPTSWCHSMTALLLAMGLACADDKAAPLGDDPALLAAPDVAGWFPEASNVNGTIVHDLGLFETTAGETADIVFEAGADTAAFQVVAVSHPGTHVIVLAARAPDGTDVVLTPPPVGVDVAAVTELSLGFVGQFTSPNRVIATPRFASALIPNTPRVAMMAGRWTLRVGVFRMGQANGNWSPVGLRAKVRVGIVEKRRPLVEHGAIDLVLSFDARSGLTAASAAQHPTIAAMLEHLETALGGVGISLRDVTWRDVSLSDAVVHFELPGCFLGTEVARVFDEAGAPEGNAVQLVFFEKFSCVHQELQIEVRDQFLGMGLPAIPFARRSGALISTYSMDAYPEPWAWGVAHEVCHSLGLFHAVEFGGVAKDNLADTPEDEASARANLMYFNAAEFTAPTLTPDQGAVMRLSPLVFPSPD